LFCVMFFHFFSVKNATMSCVKVVENLNRLVVQRHMEEELLPLLTVAWSHHLKQKVYCSNYFISDCCIVQFIWFLYSLFRAICSLLFMYNMLRISTC